MSTFTSFPVRDEVALNDDMIDLNELGASINLLTGPLTAATVQATLTAGDWASAVLTVEVSNNGAAYAALPSPVTITGDGITPVIDVTGYQFIRARVSTVAGATAKAHVTIFAQRGPGV